MRWTTANVKNPGYQQGHEIYVGTHTGSFKKLTPAYAEDPFVQKNLQDVAKLEKDSRVTTLAFGDAAQTEILIGRGGCTAESHSLHTESVQHTYDFQASPIVGLARYNDRLIGGLSNGEIQVLVMPPEEGDTSKTTPTEAACILKAGDDMTHLRQCPAQRQLVATGGNGRQNCLKVFDLEAGGKQVFTSKNLPNDFLQLEVPVWDSDVGFIDQQHLLATCSRHGYVRFYDTRKQRRPVQVFATEEQMSFTTLAAHGNYIYSGTTMGALKAFDVRRMKTFVHTYKGFTGGISDVHLDASGKFLASASLDRYVRVHNVDSTVLLYQCYVKSKVTRVLIRENPSGVEETLANDEEAVEAGGKRGKGSAADEAGGRQRNGKPALAEDKEYEDLFENMQTVTENEAGETLEEADGAEEEEEKADDAREEETPVPAAVQTDKTSKKRNNAGKANRNKNKRRKNY